MPIRLTAVDTETGEESTVELENTYVLIAAGTCYVADTQTYPTEGTCVVTIKGVGSRRIAQRAIRLDDRITGGRPS